MRLTPLALTPFLIVLALPVPADSPAQPAVKLRYQLKAGEALRYRLTADIHGTVPILDSPEPTELNASIKIVYVATPKTKLADGTSDVDFAVESAELEVEKIPFPIPDDQARDILNQSIILAQTGEVKRVQGGKPLPFGVSIPGVDPKRLYALLFPVVFLETPVKPGDNWNYRSELLGGQGAVPTFNASWLPQPESRSPGSPRDLPDLAQLAERFHMAVDQKLDKEKKPVKDGEPARYTRQGKIEGSGLINFRRARGLMESGSIKIKADIIEDLVGAPDREDQPKRMASKIDATVRVQLEPKGAQPAPAGAAPGAREVRK